MMDRGVALTLVLWALFALAALSAAALGFVLRDAERAGGAMAAARAEAVADGLVARAVFALLDPDERARLPRDGAPVEAAFMDHATRLSVRDAWGLVDVNAAPREALEGLLMRAGADAASAGVIVEGWLAARRAALERAPPGGLPKAFHAVGEIRDLPGVTDELHHALAPHLTVATGVAAVDPWAAAPFVLEALTGAGAEEVAAFVLARRRLEDPDPPSSFAGAAFAVSSGRIYEIRAEVEDEAGHLRTARALVATPPADEPEARVRVLAYD